MQEADTAVFPSTALRQANLPPYRLSHYPPFLRSYRDLTFFALSLSVHVPSHILPALPLPPPSFDQSPSETRLLCYNLSRWFARLTAEAAHRDHPETRNFIETEYSYHPLAPNPDYAPPLVVKRWRAVMDNAAHMERGYSLDLGAGLGLPNGVLSTPATPINSSKGSGGGGFLGFGGSKSSSSSAATTGGKGLSLSRNVNDDDEDLVAARMEVTRLELQFDEAAAKGGKVVASRALVTTQLTALANRLHTLAGVEDTRPLSAELGLPRDLRKIAEGIPAIDLTQQATSHTETMTLLYQLGYQSSNARSAKEALLARNALVEEHHDASKRALLKKREVEHLKTRMGSSSAGQIARDRIEIAIDEFGEASRYAHALRQTLTGLSKSMHRSLQGHSRNAHADLHQALVEHAKGSVYHLRKDIQALKGLRADLRGEARQRAPAGTGEGKGGEPMSTSASAQSLLSSPPQLFSRASFDSGFGSGSGTLKAQAPGMAPAASRDSVGSIQAGGDAGAAAHGNGAGDESGQRQQEAATTAAGASEEGVRTWTESHADGSRPAPSDPDAAQAQAEARTTQPEQTRTTSQGGLYDASSPAPAREEPAYAQTQGPNQSQSQSMFLPRPGAGSAGDGASISTSGAASGAASTFLPLPRSDSHFGSSQSRNEAYTHAQERTFNPNAPSSAFGRGMGGDLSRSESFGSAGGAAFGSASPSVHSPVQGAGAGAPPSFGFGSLSASVAGTGPSTGFGSGSGFGPGGAGPGPGGAGAGRGRGRISASEAARSLAGRF